MESLLAVFWILTDRRGRIKLRLSPVERGILRPRGDSRYCDQQSASQERISFIALIAAGGFSAAQQLIIIGGDAASESTKSNESDWWVARAISPLKESWNVWSDAVVILGLGAIGIGSFVLLATDQSENPSLALLFIGFIAGGAALFSLALLAE